MPLYEYVCEADGTVLELMRPMSQADAPVEDPAGKGRAFVRKISTFAAKGGPAAGSGHVHTGGCCPCGKNQGGCGIN
jgi:putative FmdB family regulatory protein